MKQIMAQLIPGMERCLIPNDNGTDPIISGPVHVHQPGPNGNVMKVRLLGKAYESNFGHFVVFYQDKKYSNVCAYVNLKNCTVQEMDTLTLKIVSQDCDGREFVMSVVSPQELERWRDALKPKENFKMLPNGSKSPVIPRSPMMPTLEESEEE